MRAPKNATISFSPNRINCHSKAELLGDNERRIPFPMKRSPINENIPALTIPWTATIIHQLNPNGFANRALKEKMGRIRIHERFNILDGRLNVE